jgi:hypothetical protein
MIIRPRIWTPGHHRPPVLDDGALEAFYREQRQRWRHVRDPRVDRGLSLAPAFIQRNQDTLDTAGSPATLTIAFDVNVTAGSTSFVAFRVSNATDTVTSVVGSTRGAYTRDAGPTTMIANTTSHVFRNSSGTAGAETITITMSAIDTLRMIISEYSGVSLTSPLDQSNLTATGTSTAPLSNSVTTTQASELLIGYINSETSLTFTAGASYTDRSEFATERVYWEDRIVAATGSYTAGGTLSASDPWGAMILTYKATVVTLPGASKFVGQAVPRASRY